MTRTDANAGFGSLFASVASLTLAVQGAPGRRYQAGAARPQPRGWLAQAVGLLLTWSERVRERRHLLQFDDHLLRDIGISRAEALAEAEKPFWRA